MTDGDPTRPYFRFNPGAYERGVLERTGMRCDGCGATDGWTYRGSIYAGGEQPVVCARCIAEGVLPRLMNEPDLQLHDVELDGATPDAERELLQRTPGVACFNPYRWPVADGLPMAFIGYGSDEALWSDPATREAMREHWSAETGAELDGPTEYLLVFRAVDGERFGFAIDPD